MRAVASSITANIFKYREDHGSVCEFSGKNCFRCKTTKVRHVEEWSVIFGQKEIPVYDICRAAFLIKKRFGDSGTSFKNPTIIRGITFVFHENYKHLSRFTFYLQTDRQTDR